MMPELGKYAGYVLSSYAVSLVILAVLILIILRANRSAKRQLDQVEGHNNG
jgi:heme exporter protein D